MITANQNAYVPDRFINEAGRLISDLLEMRHILNMEGYHLKIDIKNVFGSVHHPFLLVVLKNMALRKSL